MTAELFREDAYLREIEARVVAVDGQAFATERTVFYPAAGGQPSDTGTFAGATSGAIVDGRKADDGIIWHLTDSAVPAVEETLLLALDWERRHRLMRMHTCLHLLCKAVDAPVTGGQIADDRGRLDFAVAAGAFDKAALTQTLNHWIGEDRPVRDWWIDADELDRREDLVRTMSVRPPRGDGRIRLVEIDGVDLQACGGTHVRSTAEVGPVEVSKIENKGKQNRRFTVRFL